MTTQPLKVGDHVRLNAYSATYKISHFDERGTQAYLLPAPTVKNGAKRDRTWQPINQLEKVTDL